MIIIIVFKNLLLNYVVYLNMKYIIDILLNVYPSKPLSREGIRGFNESRSFIYTQLYKITSKCYVID